jgi:hypothetical protein
MFELALPLVVLLLALPVLAMAALGAWLRRRPHFTVEERLKIWDVFMKGIPITAAAITATVAFAQYSDTRFREMRRQEQQAAQQVEARQREIAQAEDQFAQRTREFNVNLYRPLKTTYEQKYALYHETADILATLATQTPEMPEYRIARKRFLRLYWGQMAMIERRPSFHSSAIESHMVGFKLRLEQYERTRERLPASDGESLEQRSLALARVFQDDLIALENAKTAPKDPVVVLDEDEP